MSFLIINGLGVEFAEMERSVVNTVMVQSATTTSAAASLVAYSSLYQTPLKFEILQGSLLVGGVTSGAIAATKVLIVLFYFLLPIDMKRTTYMKHLLDLFLRVDINIIRYIKPFSSLISLPDSPVVVSGYRPPARCDHCGQCPLCGAAVDPAPGHTPGLHQPLSARPPCPPGWHHRSPVGRGVRGKGRASDLQHLSVHPLPCQGPARRLDLCCQQDY